MAEKKGGKVKFVRIKGRVVPIAADKYKGKDRAGSARRPGIRKKAKRRGSPDIAGYRASGKGLTNRGRTNIELGGRHQRKKQTKTFGLIGTIAGGVAGKVKGKSALLSAVAGGIIGAIGGAVGGEAYGRSKRKKELIQQYKRKHGKAPSTSV